MCLLDREQEAGHQGPEQGREHGQREAPARGRREEDLRRQGVPEAKVDHFEREPLAVGFPGECSLWTCIYRSVAADFEMDLVQLRDRDPKD